MKPQTVNQRIHQLENQIHIKETAIALAKFMPEDEKFQEVSKLKSELFQLYDERSKGHGEAPVERIQASFR